MNRILSTAAALGISLSALAPAFAADYGQLAASAGLSPAEAAGMSLSEIAATKFNREAGRDDAQTVYASDASVAVDPARHAQLIASAKLTPAEAEGLTIAELAAGKYNAGVDSDERQGIVVISSRGPVRASPQLLSAAGLSVAEAQGLSLNDIAAYKFNRDTRADDRQTTRY